MSNNNSSNLICFGDVIKLSTKSAFVEGGDSCCMGFLEQKSSLLLVVPPAKDELKDKFMEAEFIVSPIRGDKPPVNGTPLSYKQPFVLKTSDGSGYSLNNKTPSQNDVVSLQVSGIKGEMYVTVEKEGFAGETHVQDGDMNVELTVVDSNRIRKKYNNKSLTHFSKPKSDAPGGFVSCGTKGQVLTFKLIKVPEKTETAKYVKDPIIRRASQQLMDAAKADETSEASVLESPSRAGSIVSPVPLVTEGSAVLVSAPSSPKNEGPETPADEVVTTTTPVASGAAVTLVPEPAKADTAAPVVESTQTSGVNPAELAAHLVHVVLEDEIVDTPDESSPEESVVAAPAPVVVKDLMTFSSLATIELDNPVVPAPVEPAPDRESMDGSAPVHFKMATVAAASPKATVEPTAVTGKKITITAGSEIDTLSGLTVDHEEQIDTACVGKCSIM